MAKDRIVCGIDVGSSKIATLIASVDESPSGGGKINLIGVSSTPSNCGVKASSDFPNPVIGGIGDIQISL